MPSKFRPNKANQAIAEFARSGDTEARMAQIRELESISYKQDRRN